MPKKKLNIVLDIDSTLVQTFESLEDLYNIIEEGTDEELLHLQEKTYGFRVEDPEEDGTTRPYFMWGITRPHLKEFILFCIENFKNVYIWSAGSSKYVRKIVEHIFEPLGYVPPIVFDGNHTYINEEQEVVNKPLERIFKESNGEANEKNTIAIDDRRDTFSLNEKNGILIPGFDLDDGEDEKKSVVKTIEKFIMKDNCLAELIVFLDKIKDVDDVRTIDFSNVFSGGGKAVRRGNPVISPSYRKKSGGT